LSATANDRLRVISVFFAALAAGIAATRILAAKWQGIALVACCIELFAFNVPFNALAPVRYYKPDLPILDRLRAAIAQRPGRVVGFDWVFLPNASVHYGVEDIRGSDPMALARYVAFFKLLEAPDPYSDVKRVQNVHQPALDFLGVRYLMTEPGHRAGAPWQLRYEGRDGNLYENPRALPRFFAPEIAEPMDATRPLVEQLRGIPDFANRAIAEGIAQSVSGRPETLAITQSIPTSFRLQVETSSPAFIASSVVAAPGWRIILGRERLPIHAVNGAFIGFVVPPGKHEVRVMYKPRSVVIGMALSAITALAVFPLIRARNRERSTPGTHPARSSSPLVPRTGGPSASA
jgi:hypothetical protein